MFQPFKISSILEEKATKNNWIIYFGISAANDASILQIHNSDKFINTYLSQNVSMSGKFFNYQSSAVNLKITNFWTNCSDWFCELDKKINKKQNWICLAHLSQNRVQCYWMCINSWKKFGGGGGSTVTKHRHSGTVFHRLLTQPSCSKLSKRMEWKKIMDVHIHSAPSCWRLRGAVTAWQGWGTSDERNLHDAFAACKPVHPNTNTQTKKGTVRDTLRWLCYTISWNSKDIQISKISQNLILRLLLLL